MANLLGRYLFKLKPTLPAEQVVQMLNYSVQGTPCIAVAADSAGIYYVPAEQDNIDDPQYAMVYSAEKGAWTLSSVRYIDITEEQTVEDDSWLLNNLAEAVKPKKVVTFSVRGESFTAAAGISWFTWFQGYSKSIKFAPTVDGLVTYNGYVISYNGKDVGVYDFIVSGEYTIEPQVRIALTLTEKAELNPLFAHSGSEGCVFKPNRTYQTPIIIEENNYYALPKEKTYLNAYVSYQIGSNILTVWVDDIPVTSGDYPAFDVTIEIVRKIYDELTEIPLNVANDNCTVTELAPPYKVNIYGDYYVLSNNADAGLSSTPVAIEGKTAHGVIMSSTYMSYLEEFNMKIIPISLLPVILGMSMECAKRLYATTEWLTSYINQEIYEEDVLGETVFFADGNITTIRTAFIAQYAESEGVSVDEVVLELRAAASEANMTYEEYLDQFIETTTECPIEELRYCELVPADKSVLTGIDAVLALTTNLYAAGLSVSGYNTSGILLYAMNGSKVPVKSEYSYTPPSNTKLFGIYNGDTPITQNFVASRENDFNITTPYTGIGSQIDSRHYWSIGAYTPPPDRNTPGSVQVTLMTCLAGNTLIEMGGGSQKRLDEICVNDLVKTPYGVERVIFTDAKSNKQRNAYTDYYFSDDTVLRVIKNHRVYNPKRKKYVHITTLDIGDAIVKSNGDQVILVDKRTVQERISHYTIFTENCNGYYANGILCGNIFANIKVAWIRKMLLRLYNKFILSKEQRLYEKS